jgi:hypothetical protein
VKNFPDPRLSFSLPPQHFAETAIGARQIPSHLPESVLANLALVPSKESSLVFRDDKRRTIHLTVAELLSWGNFELMLPDLNRVGSLYDLEIPRETLPRFTRIEMPWGVDLTPIAVRRSITSKSEDRFVWDHNLIPTQDEWTELWSSVLRNADDGNAPVSFELLSVRGFKRGATKGSTFEGTLVIEYSDDQDNLPPDWLGGRGDPTVTTTPRLTTPLTNLNRIELAASLSRRFPYSGVPGKSPVDTGVLNYASPFNYDKQQIKNCFMPGRSLQVDQFRLSPRGGWLEFDNHWKPAPDCALTGWSHIASMGRDRHVKLEKAGFLFPFGIEANLIVLSEEVFVKDEQEHFVAVLVKQVFIEVPQPNGVAIPNGEGIFQSVSIITTRTAALDVPPSGDPGQYFAWDFFLPTVDGQPVQFEHTGIDWGGDPHSSRMPLLFVSNDSRSPNGLIWEPGYADWKPKPAPDDRDPAHAIPRSEQGLRVLDMLWNSRPYRFATYNDDLIALATPLEHGDTSQRVEWAEWTRGPVPDLDKSGIAPRPFVARTRTLKLRLHGLTQFSGETKYSLGTYRDVRFTHAPLLDPEPTAAEPVYTANLLNHQEPESSPYLVLLETRDLVGQNVSQLPQPDDASRKRIRSLYFGLAKTPEAIPESLFEMIDNEIQFGMTASSAGTGGLAVPDTPASTLTRRYGPVGDSSFSWKRWDGYENKKAKLESMHRLDYAAYRREHRSQIDLQPFDNAQTPSDLDDIAKSASALMGYQTPSFLRTMVDSVSSLVGFTSATAPATASPVGATPGLSLGDLFGAEAQLIPGLSFADLFSKVALGGSSMSSTADTSGSPLAKPLQWKFQVTGIDWLVDILGDGAGKLSFKDLLSLAANESQSPETSVPVSFGIEASLHWINEAFEPVTVGPVDFIPKPNSTKIEIDAHARMSIGAAGLPSDFSNLKLAPGKAETTARAVLSEFTISVFNAIEIDFRDVSFDMSADGKNTVSTNIGDVRLKGPLEFINQPSKVLGGLGGDSGINIDVSLARVKIGQTLRFPKTEGDPLFIGPAQITNLSFGWGLTIPLVGRDVLSISFALSSREKPLTIFVPPWYGGKAHVLLELTTKGMRLLEVSMEYGAVIPIRWGIANGQASLTAGVFYMLERVVDGQGQLTDGKVIFRAFVNAAANVVVAGIIHFDGQIYIALSYVKEGNRKLIIGEATVSCSIKIGFFRVSYSFSATHVEEAQGSSSAGATLHRAPAQVLNANFEYQAIGNGGSRKQALRSISLNAKDSIISDTNGLLSGVETTMPRGNPGDVQLFGKQFDKKRKRAFQRLLKGYAQ